MTRRLAGPAIVALLLATGCAQVPGLMAGRTAIGDLDALGRKAIGGDAYAGFKIAPALPKADGPRQAVKLTYLMTDDTAHQSPQSLGMLKMMGDVPQAKVHNVVFRDGAEQGDSKPYYMCRLPTRPRAPCATPRAR